MPIGLIPFNLIITDIIKMLGLSRFAKTRTAEGVNRWDLLFDVLSYPVKLAANNACPTHTMSAELTRTAISISERSMVFMGNMYA